MKMLYLLPREFALVIHNLPHISRCRHIRKCLPTKKIPTTAQREARATNAKQKEMGNRKRETLGGIAGGKKKFFNFCSHLIFMGSTFLFYIMLCWDTTSDGGSFRSAESQRLPRFAVDAHLRQLLHAANRLTVGQQGRKLIPYPPHLENLKFTHKPTF